MAFKDLRDLKDFSDLRDFRDLRDLKDFRDFKDFSDLSDFKALRERSSRGPPSGISSPQWIGIIRWGIGGYVDSAQKFRQIGGTSERRIFGV